jgi:hypothetical protein
MHLGFPHSPCPKEPSSTVLMAWNLRKSKGRTAAELVSLLKVTVSRISCTMTERLPDLPMVDDLLLVAFD